MHTALDKRHRGNNYANRHALWPFFPKQEEEAPLCRSLDPERIRRTNASIRHFLDVAHPEDGPGPILVLIFRRREPDVTVFRLALVRVEGSAQVTSLLFRNL